MLTSLGTNNITLMHGDMFESKCQTITNPVNCKGVMGAGLALLFKKKYPRMFYFYQQKCRDRELKLGEPYVWKETDPWILNFPTKYDWRTKSDITWIENGLRYLVRHYEKWGITSLAIPALGCGLGDLSWVDVAGTMPTYLVQMKIPVEIYLPR